MSTTEIMLAIGLGILVGISYQLRAISRQIEALIKLRFPDLFER